MPDENNAPQDKPCPRRREPAAWFFFFPLL
jgi:hypothetical protein